MFQTTNQKKKRDSPTKNLQWWDHPELMLDDLHMSHPLSYRLVSTFCSQDVDTEDLKSPISREIFEPTKIINGTHIYIYTYIYICMCVYVNLFHCMICFEQPLQVPEMLQDMSIECVSGVFWIWLCLEKNDSCCLLFLVSLCSSLIKSYVVL